MASKLLSKLLALWLRNLHLIKGVGWAPTGLAKGSIWMGQVGSTLTLTPTFKQCLKKLWLGLEYRNERPSIFVFILIIFYCNNSKAYRFHIHFNIILFHYLIIPLIYYAIFKAKHYISQINVSQIRQSHFKKCFLAVQIHNNETAICV